MKFNIGDRVRCVASYQDGVFPGECGTVLLYGSDGRLGICWDDYHKRRHKLNGRIPAGHGWYVPEYCVVYDHPNDFGVFPTAQEADISSLFA